MSADSRPASVVNTLSPPARLSPELTKTYGYIWADWLFGHEKDAFMVKIFNDCKDIDQCTDAMEKASKLSSLRNELHGCKQTWSDGVLDFLEFELQYLERGIAPLDDFSDAEDDRTIAIIHAAYLHGAFRSLCKTAGGAEWIGRLAEFCAAAVHQGFKWVRLSGGISDWELPTMGESWCKGATCWALVSMYIAIDVAGADSTNDAAIERMHTLIGSHHLAGYNWLKYRGPHPHKWWSKVVRGKAPSEASIRSFGERHSWPEQMIDILCRGANHVNSWKNSPFSQVHEERTRGLVIWDHTPRLKSRLVYLGNELAQFIDDVTDSEVQEIISRFANWASNHTTVWHGRGDRDEKVLELTLLGALVGVLRESRACVPEGFIDRAMAWSRERVGHISPILQDLLLGLIFRGLQIRGRVPGAVDGYGSEGAGHTRYHDGFWHVSTWSIILAHPTGGKELPMNMRELFIRYFNAMTKKRRHLGVDFSAGSNYGGDCPVCIGNSIFEGCVDNRPSPAVWHCLAWGVLVYHNLGLGSPDDTDLGTIDKDG